MDELIVSVAAIPTGAPPTTAAITAAVWSFLFDTLYTAEQYLKAAGAAAGGSSHLVTPTAVSFKSLDGAETYVASAVDAVGNRNNSYPNL